MPIVSVILPAYNAANTLGHSVASVQRQGFEDWELIVVDDGSSDNTADAVASLAADDPRIVLHRQENAGAAAARNTGLAMASGAWIQFLDADDQLEPGHFEAMLAAAEAAPAAGLVHCGWQRVLDKQRWWTPHPAFDFASPFAIAARTCPFAIHAVMVKREIIAGLGGFDTTLKVCEDWDLWQRIARSGTVFQAVNDVWVDVYVRPGSLSSDLSSHLRDGLAVIRRGHGEDSRMAAPAPLHAGGEPASGLEDAVWSHALWVASAAIGRGLDPLDLLETIPERLETQIDVAMLAQIVEDALVVGALAPCPPWPDLWQRVETGLQRMFTWLDDQAPQAKLGNRLRNELSLRVVEQIGTARPAAIGNIRIERVELTATIPSLELPECERLRCVVLCHGEELCTFDQIVFEGISGHALRRAIVKRVDSEELRTKLADWHLHHGPTRYWQGAITEPRSALRLWRAATRARLGRDRAAGRMVYEDVLDLLYRAEPPREGQASFASIRDRFAAPEQGILQTSQLVPEREKQAMTGPRPGEIVDYNKPDFWEKLYDADDPWDYGNSYELRKYQQTLDILGDRRFGRALELACAEGNFTRLLARRCDEVIASDISLKAVEHAREVLAGHDNVSVVQLDLVSDPLPGMFDLIVCSEVLYYTSDYDAIYRFAERAAQHLAPGGLLVMANARQIVDEPATTGFSWDHTVGAKGIGDMAALVPALSLRAQWIAPLYRIHCFERRHEPRDAGTEPAPDAGAALPDSDAPDIRAIDMAYPLPAHVARQVVWRGGTDMPASDAWQPFPILMYHRIVEDGPPGLAQWRTSPQDFAAQLQWLADNGYTGVTLARMAEAFTQGKPLPAKSVVITFDDATRDFLDNALPLLHRHGFPAALFVPTGAVGWCAHWDRGHGEPAPILDWEEIASLTNCDVTVGSHAMDHVRLTGLPPRDLARELIGSRATLEGRLGTAPDAIAYPFGAFDPAIRDMTADCGYALGLTCVEGLITRDADMLALRRQEVKGGMTLVEFAALVGHTEVPTAVPAH
ncbi:glycosyltransferase [Novosphingobium sp. YJ-S2-02]|uniref:Chitooligosaccharide deacetylase n=1 Tax=Novosphingobium aureum TaxID=2792964 RepID=A0A931MJE5_9SPHN|nr:trifunctional glycosyltransferase/class I SAM-dependent methyltransferase/polysaccharide deacetylase [Novosphingobium aureum]MBH0111339.1 glycosyltransferase [Novosphingobium aureum]